MLLHGDALAFTANCMIVEDSPARDAVVAAITAHLVRHGGVALLIDYGHARSAPGDTLQAVRDHRFADPLADPGEQDLTAHVDFESVTDAAHQAGAAVTALAPQGEWLTRIGIVQRAESLIRQNPDRASDIGSALSRLTATDQMGEMFKVIALHSPNWPTPAGFE